jgi:hypothetical protein
MMLVYFDQLEDAVQYLVAIGSLVGVLGLIVGIIGFISLGKYNRQKMIAVIVVSIILLTVCGSSTGFKYFHIRH